MIDDKKRAEIDQGITAMSEIYPLMWKSLYDGLIVNGFTECQAMELVKAYIVATSEGK